MGSILNVELDTQLHVDMSPHRTAPASWKAPVCPFPVSRTPWKITIWLLLLEISFVCFQTSYKWNHIVFAFCSWLPLFNTKLSKLIHGVCVAVVHVLLAVYYFIEWTQHGLLIHSCIRGGWGCFSSCPQWVTIAMNVLGVDVHTHFCLAYIPMGHTFFYPSNCRLHAG